MTEIERKALALVNEVRVDDRYRLCPDPTLTFGLWEALCRAIEQHEAFRQEVSDAVEVFMPGTKHQEAYLNYAQHFARFIIAKPDPLVEAMGDALEAQGKGRPKHTTPELTKHLRAAIEKRGGKIVWGEG